MSQSVAPHPLDAGTGTIIMVAKKPRWLAGLWTTPDPDLVDAGLRGEWLIAGIRVLIVLIFLAVPLDFATSGDIDSGKWRLAAWVAAGGLAEAVVIYTAVMGSWGRGWIGFLSGILDASLVSLGLLIYNLLDRPLDATRDMVIFPIYLLAIGATSLRYDWRISILTGLTSILQYLALTYYSLWNWRLDHLLDDTAVAEFSWKEQIARVLLLVIATALSTMVILRAYEQRRRSNRDRLTNLANRGFFDESLARLGAISARSGEPVSVAMFDVDHFKKFNDTYGHQAGDNALRAVADMLGNSFRTTDLVARYGGEEFAGLFPGMSLEDAERRLETLRGRIEKMVVRIDSVRTAKVTISIGVAVWPEDGEELKEALAQADYRLYQAKHTGRNRVVTTSDSGYFQALGDHSHAKRR